MQTTRTGLNHGCAQMQFLRWCIFSVVSGVSEWFLVKSLGAGALQLKMVMLGFYGLLVGYECYLAKRRECSRREAVHLNVKDMGLYPKARGDIIMSDRTLTTGTCSI